MKQIIRPISDLMLYRIEAQRDWVRNHYDKDSIAKYESFEGKLKLLETILKSNWIRKDETNKLQCLGITLGDAFVQDLNFKWVEAEDEYGIDPAVKLGGTSLILFPFTMISKRIENDEDVNIYELYETVRLKVLEIKDEV